MTNILASTLVAQASHFSTGYAKFLRRLLTETLTSNLDHQHTTSSHLELPSTMAPKVPRLSQFQRHRLESARAAKEVAFHQAATTSGKALLTIPELLESEKLFLRQGPGKPKDAINTLLVQRRVRPKRFQSKFKEGTKYYPHRDCKTTWLYAFDLSTLAPESSACKMFLCGRTPMKRPLPEVYSMDFVEDRYEGEEISG
ncbi:hypothetical protein LTR95_019033 [Oleoguttula sp. CCFEE 5521]